MDSINDKIKDIYSLPITEQTKVIKDVASEMLEIISERRSEETIALTKKVMENIQGIRHMMAARKFDNVQIDADLKSAYQALESLIKV